MRKLGIIGGRGLVGTELLNRMEQCGDFQNFDVSYFSTSQHGSKCSLKGARDGDLYLDANNLDQLMEMDIILTVQGSEYSHEIYPLLEKKGYQGYFLDGSSAFRMEKDAVLLLDPLNSEQIKNYVQNGGRRLVGSNCTVSLLLLALNGLIKNDLIEWVSSQTYQAVSGAGAKAILEYIDQIKSFAGMSEHKLDSLPQLFARQEFCLGGPILGNILPWIDSDLGDGQSKEEWKAQVEASKILDKEFLIDGTCVRVGSLRVHAQALTIKLKKDLPLNEVEKYLKEGGEWIEYISNNRKETLQNLTPYHFQNTLKIGVGRVRKIHGERGIINLFTLGDQLLWGAAEPLRRALYLLN